MTSDPRIDRLEGEVHQLNARFTNLENSVNARFSEVNSRLTSLENSINSRFSEVNSRLNTLTMLMFISVGATILTAVGIIVAVLITR
ncbi:MAG TPA: hypothetical protein VFA32_10235 [Dehalococcoidia bacterium]|jgi:hypothetical protein|nr:hypothetical protein [Dehalococcoidia bacterium]